MKKTDMTHSDLVGLAFNWLKKDERCSVVISELATAARERADAIGWRGSMSILVEAKTSVQDFRADRKKGWRIIERLGIGVKRYYLVPQDLRDKMLVLLPRGWGLLVPDGHGLSVARPSIPFRSNARREIDLLVSCIRRIASNGKPLVGVGVKCYIHDPAHVNPVARLSVSKSEHELDGRNGP